MKKTGYRVTYRELGGSRRLLSTQNFTNDEGFAEAKTTALSCIRMFDCDVVVRIYRVAGPYHDVGHYILWVGGKTLESPRLNVDNPSLVWRTIRKKLIANMSPMLRPAIGEKELCDDNE